MIAAVRAQNAQVAIGQLGGAPAVQGPAAQRTITAQDRLQTPEQFRAILLRGNADGSVLRWATSPASSSVRRSTTIISRFNGKPATGVADLAGHRRQRAGHRRAACEANARGACEAVLPDRAWRRSFPSTPRRSSRSSIKGVIKTLLEAIVLVFLVMYLFLQNFRATLIPTIAVPVVLLGTFGVLAALGYSVNMLTMFAMVLAIGLLVDDAIVVVENVERIMREEGLSPLEATRKSMDQITGALVGIATGARRRCSCRWRSWRLDRRHLPPVLGDHRLGDGAVGAGRDRADPGAVRHHAEAGAEGRDHAARRRLLRLVQPRVRPRQRSATSAACAASCAGAAASWPSSPVMVVLDGRAVPAPAHARSCRRKTRAA